MKLVILILLDISIINHCQNHISNESLYNTYFYIRINKSTIMRNFIIII
jgi:hypothetical protein